MEEKVPKLKPVPENVFFPKEEEDILKFWKHIDAFKTSVKQSKNRPRYTFYDGPPFATGLPHYGHILAGTVKDIVTRYAHMNGYQVERRFGWDTHGLPVEYEIDKKLGIKSPEDVQKMGIDVYNNECRSIVMRYAKEWEDIVTRLGRWIDFENDYKTLYPWFMESVWWVFKQLYNKGLVFRGVKVMPFSTACSTPLSNFELAQNYKDIVDPAVIVSFPLDDEPETSVVAWTTTPWTLPSNMALCVNPNLDYVKIKDKKSNSVYILMEARLEILYKRPQQQDEGVGPDFEYEILEKFPGKKLEGRSYEPILPYFRHLKHERGAFRVVCDDYVTTESGTGVVHQAPYFGEDDYRVCLKYGIISKDMQIVCPVDESGKFTEEVTDFVGMYVKDADKEIMRKLKEDGRLVHRSTFTHSYPFCWRSDTPLIYKAVPSWFVNVPVLVSKLLENNDKTYWVPDFVREKRFANWLKDARDWAISRNRYWGTPIPLWVSEDIDEVVCVGSIAELEQLTGQKVADLHREVVDKLTIPSRMGKGALRRVSEVFDCWFESGSMPYGQVHYPFENRKEFEDAFPADFIAEGIDQTRGWFYTLLVLSTALFGRPPFKNLIVHGLVLAADGNKMSKRKKNYPDPIYVVSNYGADALRLYLITSPVVRGENLKFKEEGVRDMVKDVFIPWFNAYRFLVQNVLSYEKESGESFSAKLERSENVLDRWILSFSNSLVQFVREEMAAYRLYTVIPRLVKYVDVLTNWFIRLNRKRLKGDMGREECLSSLETLYHVLLIMVRLMSPFTPFLTEYMWRNLRHLLDPESGLESVESVHYLMLSAVEEHLIDKAVEKRVGAMQAVIELGRVLRERKTLPLKYPVKEIVVIHREKAFLEEVREMEGYILDELNTRKLVLSEDKEKWGVKLKAEPDFRLLGQRLKGDMKAVQEQLKKMSDEQLSKFLDEGKLEVLGHQLSFEELKVGYLVGNKSLHDQYVADSDGDVIVLLDITPDQSLQDEGLAREIVNRIQKLRKKAKLLPQDEVTVYCTAEPEQSDLGRVLLEQLCYVETCIKQPVVTEQYPTADRSKILAQETSAVKGDKLKLTIVDRREGPGLNLKEAVNSSEVFEQNGPVIFVAASENSKIKVKVALESNLEGDEGVLTYSRLKLEASTLLDLWKRPNFRFALDVNGKEVLHPMADLKSLEGKTLYVKYQ